MQRTGKSGWVDRAAHDTTKRDRHRITGARKTTGKPVAKTGDSGKDSTRKSDIRNPGRAPKPAIKRSSGGGRV